MNKILLGMVMMAGFAWAECGALVTVRIADSSTANGNGKGCGIRLMAWYGTMPLSGTISSTDTENNTVVKNFIGDTVERQFDPQFTNSQNVTLNITAVIITADKTKEGKTNTFTTYTKRSNWVLVKDGTIYYIHKNSNGTYTITE